MANRKGLRKQPDQVFSTKSLISSLQSQLDTDSDLRAALAGDLEKIDVGSNRHLEQLIGVASTIENDINELLGDLALAWSTLDVYSVAASTDASKDIDLCEATAVLKKVLPDNHEWEARMHESFKRLWSMKHSLVQH